MQNSLNALISKAKNNSNKKKAAKNGKKFTQPQERANSF